MGSDGDRFAVIHPHEPAGCTACGVTTSEAVVFGCWWDGMAMARGAAPAWNVCESCMRDGVCHYISDGRRESVLEEFCSE